MSQRRQKSSVLLLFWLSPVSFFLLLPARPVCPTNSDLENTLLEQPKISCEESRIRMSIRTDRPFAGNVYAKGFFHKDICRVQGNGSGHVANITIPVNADCGMRRRRSMAPHGLSLEIDVILMFHRKFLTKNDRAFHVECQYVEMDQRVGNRLDVSALPSTELSQSLSHSQTMPKCRYEVLSSETGHPISFAAIGQPLMHKWSCHGANSKEEGVNLYCLTVHIQICSSCEVDDGQGSVQKLLDDKGCPLDKGLFGPVDYKGDLEALQKGNAFKFADRPTIYFSCQLRLELKSGWKECKRSAENCMAPSAASPIESGTPQMPFSEAPASDGDSDEEDGGNNFNTDGFSSPEFPTPSPTFPSSGAGFSMSTGTTAKPSYPATRIESSQLEDGDEEPKEPIKEKPRGKGGKVQPHPMARGKAKKKEEEKHGEEEEPEEKEGVYIERPTLSIIRKTKRTTRSSSTSTTRLITNKRPTPTTPSSLPNGGQKGAEYALRGCQSNEFGLNSDCATFDSAPSPFSGSNEAKGKEAEAEEDGSPEFVGQRFPGRLSLRQRSTTPLEEMERMGRMSSASAQSVDIDVSQAVDVLDVVAQSDTASGRDGLEKFCRQVPSRRTFRPKAEPVEPFQQLCISRQLLSSALFLAVLCLLSMLTIFVCCLISCQHRLRLQRPRPKPPPILARRSSRRVYGENAVLEAYNP